MLLKWYDQLEAKKKKLEMMATQPGRPAAEEQPNYSHIRNTVDDAFNKWASKQQFVGVPQQVDTQGKQITMSDVDQAYAKFAVQHDVEAQVHAAQAQDAQIAKVTSASLAHQRRKHLQQQLHHQLHKQQQQQQRQRQQAQQVQQRRQQQQEQRRRQQE